MPISRTGRKKSGNKNPSFVIRCAIFDPRYSIFVVLFTNTRNDKGSGVHKAPALLLDIAHPFKRQHESLCPGFPSSMSQNRHV